MGHVEMVPVGSHAIRRVIEEYQPLISLHGHVHESPGIAEIGRTTVINPGSSYSSGEMHGALFEIQNDTLRSRQLIRG
jgi:Icc-related predicted phosphoesterase